MLLPVGHQEASASTSAGAAAFLELPWSCPRIVEELPGSCLRDAWDWCVGRWDDRLPSVAGELLPALQLQ